MEQNKKDIMEKHVKVLFYLERDEDGYPPEERESMWAVPIGNDCYKLDNIPFFVMGVSDGDIVKAEKIDGELRFLELMKPSENCTIRVFILDETKEGDIRSSLKDLECSVEGTGIEGLIAASIHKNQYDLVNKYLEKGFAEEILDYQESALR